MNNCIKCGKEPIMVNGRTTIIRVETLPYCDDCRSEVGYSMITRDLAMRNNSVNGNDVDKMIETSEARIAKNRFIE